MPKTYRKIQYPAVLQHKLLENISTSFALHTNRDLTHTSAYRCSLQLLHGSAAIEVCTVAD